MLHLLVIQRPGSFCLVVCHLPGVALDRLHGQFWLTGRCPPYSLRKARRRGQAGVVSSLLLASYWLGLVTWPHLAAREAKPCHRCWMAVYPVTTQVVLVHLGCCNEIQENGL